MPERRGILAGGHWIIDHVKMIDAWPPQDALASIASQRVANGGCAYNLLKDLSLMGAWFPLEGVGLIGRDRDGEAILVDCDALGIDRSSIRQTDAAPNLIHRCDDGHRDGTPHILPSAGRQRHPVRGTLRPRVLRRPHLSSWLFLPVGRP